MNDSEHLLFYVGVYTDLPSQSKGIAQVQLNRQTGELVRLEDIYVLRNPSYLTQTVQSLYTFSEVAEFDGAQLVCLQNQAVFSLPIKGDFPCYLDISSDGHYLAVANYGSGNVSIYSLDDKGIPVQQITSLFERGQGPNKERQLGPHAHQAVFMKRYNTLVTVDLGCDAIRFYDVLQDQFKLVQTVRLPPGTGPRHVVFNNAEQIAYVVCELSETLAIIKRTDMGWQLDQHIALLATDGIGQAAAAIKLSADERFIYVSCRYQNKISCFDVSGEKAKWLFSTDSGGDFPRDFALSSCGKWLIVANQHSNNLASYRRNVASGRLEPTGHQCTIDAAVCIAERI